MLIVVSASRSGRAEEVSRSINRSAFFMDSGLSRKSLIDVPRETFPLESEPNHPSEVVCQEIAFPTNSFSYGSLGVWTGLQPESGPSISGFLIPTLTMKSGQQWRLLTDSPVVLMSSLSAKLFFPLESITSKLSKTRVRNRFTIEATSGNPVSKALAPEAGCRARRLFHVKQ